MLRNLLLAAAVIGLAFATQTAEARGRHGCASCAAAGGGCPGGVCAVPMAAPGKMAATDMAQPAVAATPALAPTAAQPAANTYAMNRRGIFGWRR
jgi:hypothetical protein